MTDDVVKLRLALRKATDCIVELQKYKSTHAQCEKASLELEAKLVNRLKEAHQRIEQLEAALRPFAEIADVYEQDDGDNNDLAWYSRKGIPTIGMLRNARAALAGEKKDGN